MARLFSVASEPACVPVAGDEDGWSAVAAYAPFGAERVVARTCWPAPPLPTRRWPVSGQSGAGPVDHLPGRARTWRLARPVVLPRPPRCGVVVGLQELIHTAPWVHIGQRLADGGWLQGGDTGQGSMDLVGGRATAVAEHPANGDDEHDVGASQRYRAGPSPHPCFSAAAGLCLFVSGGGSRGGVAARPA